MPSAYGGIRWGTGISRVGQHEKGQSRILGKEVYFIDYNNDVHNPASRANQKAIAMRMQQFFDNKLKGAPAPDWMVKGMPYRDKGRDQLAGQPLPQTAVVLSEAQDDAARGETNAIPTAAATANEAPITNAMLAPA